MKTTMRWTVLAVSMVMLGAALAGCAGGGAGTATASEVKIEVTDAGFVPAVVNVPKGKVATLVVTRKTDQTCATEMVYAGTGEKHDLPLNETVRIELPADRPDTIDYACAMNMIKGKIVSK